MMIYKKTLTLANKYRISSVWLQWMMNIGAFGIILPLYFVFPKYITIDVSILRDNLLIPLLIGVNSILGIGTGLVSQYAYKNEKVSVLTPFGEVGRIFTIVLGFLFFSGTSVSSFIFALLAASVLILSSVDLRTFHINKYCFALLGVGLVRATNTMLIGYVISRVTAFTLISVDLLIVSIILFLFLLLSPRFSILTTEKNTFAPIFGLISINNAFWLVSYAITLFLMKDLGIVITSLLGMITMAMTILSSYVFFRDIPARKDIAVTIIILCCIVGGTVL